MSSVAFKFNYFGKLYSYCFKSDSKDDYYFREIEIKDVCTLFFNFETTLIKLNIENIDNLRILKKLTVEKNFLRILMKTLLITFLKNVKKQKKAGSLRNFYARTYLKKKLRLFL